MGKNFINYTNLTYDDIKSDIVSRMAEDSRFDNFRESSLYSVITEIFTATTDFTNYYLERRAEESFMDSAQLRSSIILLSKMLGYIVRRPIPASASIKIVIKSLPAGVVAGDYLEIPSNTVFQYDGNSFMLLRGLKYQITSLDISNFADPTYIKELNLYSTLATYEGTIFSDGDSRANTKIKLIQAEKRTKVFDGTSNTQMGTRYQTYKISDKEFSNMFGSEDFGYNVTDPSLTDITNNLTRVAIGTSEAAAFCSTNSEYDSKLEYRIDRRSFLNEETIPMLSAAESGQQTKYCVIRTTMDDSVELLFGDDNVSKIGAKNGDNIYVRYIATKGSDANKVGVIGKSIECQTSNFGLFNKTNIDFILTSNITGGSDIESIDSIKVNSPEIFYSLERCVTPRDYVNFLKTLTLTTKQTKNAIAWGEQEETRNSSTAITNIKLFNVVLFCTLSDMYKTVSDSKYGTIYTGLDSDKNVVVAPLSATEFDWFKTIVLSDSSAPLKTIELTTDPELVDLQRIYEKLYTRSQITVKNVYVSPIIQDFELSGTIYLNPLVDKNETIKKVKNAVYSYLSNNADFNTPIYKSTIIDLIENFSEVHHADVNIVPLDNLETLETFTVASSGLDTPLISGTFATKPVGFVWYTSLTSKEKYGTREYSRVPILKSSDIVKNILTTNPDCSALASFTSASYESIFCLMPNFEVISYKMDNNFAYSRLIWPSSNSYDSSACSIVTTATSASSIVPYLPSERNLYLGLVKCYLDKISKLTDVDSSSTSDLIKYYDELINLQGKCFCSVKQLSDKKKSDGNTAACMDAVAKSIPAEIKSFIDNLFYYYVKILRNTFSYEIRKNMIDSNGNISNYSMKNEIARVSMDSIKFTYK